ncbi:cytochrome P450 [Schizothecium vesticola]|uniref:Cytochrome P450 n=1 Tax=Schizothecium vesticola TaxID=314040 RepID=A0AA40EQB1_9PEZI|nr:cytochrome P450 [Schizothecium vesticola]
MLAPILLTAFAVLATYLFRKIRWARLEQFKNIPQIKPSAFWGHLKLMGELMSSGRENAHPDEMFVEISEQLGRPPCFLVDARPASWPTLLVANHETAEQISRVTKQFPWAVPKSPSFQDVIHVVGYKSLLIQEGEEWKQLRKMFNPGFAPSHLITMLPAILGKLSRFLQLMDTYAATGEVFSLSKPIINLTFDIIGAVVMDTDVDAQHEKDEDRSQLIRLFDELSQTYTGQGQNIPWYFRPRLEYRRIGIARQIDNILKPIVRQKHAELKRGSTKGRTVLDLSLQGIDDLTEAYVSLACDQIKTFLFAGHDTTAILLSWTFYELSRSPRVLKTVRDELDDLFGPDPDPESVIAKLLAPGGEELVSRMPYISAVIKEVLRLRPPAGSARMSPKGAGLMMRMQNGEDVCIDNMIIYLCGHLIQRDRNVYGETADDFVPERWLGDSDTSERTNDDAEGSKQENKITPGAWRPFERGPRSCIGQELANIEARVIIAAIARRYDITKVGLGELALNEKGEPVLNEKGQYKVKSEVYQVSRAHRSGVVGRVRRPSTDSLQTIQVTAKPVDGMKVKIKLAPNATTSRPSVVGVGDLLNHR